MAAKSTTLRNTLQHFFTLSPSVEKCKSHPLFPASSLSSFLCAARCGALGERPLPDFAGKGGRGVQCTMRNAQCTMGGNAGLEDDGATKRKPLDLAGDFVHDVRADFAASLDLHDAGGALCLVEEVDLAPAPGIALGGLSPRRGGEDERAIKPDEAGEPGGVVQDEVLEPGPLVRDFAPVPLVPLRRTNLWISSRTRTGLRSRITSSPDASASPDALPATRRRVARSSHMKYRIILAIRRSHPKRARVSRGRCGPCGRNGRRWRPNGSPRRAPGRRRKSGRKDRRADRARRRRSRGRGYPWARRRGRGRGRS